MRTFIVIRKPATYPADSPQVVGVIQVREETLCRFISPEDQQAIAAIDLEGVNPAGLRILAPTGTYICWEIPNRDGDDIDTIFTCWVGPSAFF